MSGLTSACGRTPPTRLMIAGVLVSAAVIAVAMWQNWPAPPGPPGLLCAIPTQLPAQPAAAAAPPGPVCGSLSRASRRFPAVGSSASARW